jgi:hypothetical protein
MVQAHLQTPPVSDKVASSSLHFLGIQSSMGPVWNHSIPNLLSHSQLRKHPSFLKKLVELGAGCAGNYGCSHDNLIRSLIGIG